MFVFFGVVATAGSAYVQLEDLAALPLGASVPVGFLATALLVVNNLRDIPSDTESGKRTLAVRLGDGAPGACTSRCWSARWSSCRSWPAASIGLPPRQPSSPWSRPAGRC